MHKGRKNEVKSQKLIKFEVNSIILVILPWNYYLQSIFDLLKPKKMKLGYVFEVNFLQPIRLCVIYHSVTEHSSKLGVTHIKPYVEFQWPCH